MNPALAAMFPNASQSCKDANPDHDEDRNNGSIPYPKSQPNKTPALGATVQGKAESLPRTRVRFTGYRVRPLDPDNFAGSCKDLLDGLRHSGLISGDEPWKIIFETEQKKVPSFTHEKTVITIEFPYP